MKRRIKCIDLFANIQPLNELILFGVATLWASSWAIDLSRELTNGVRRRTHNHTVVELQYSRDSSGVVIKTSSLHQYYKPLIIIIYLS